MSNQRLMKVKEKAGDGYAKTNAIAMAGAGGCGRAHWTLARLLGRKRSRQAGKTRGRFEARADADHQFSFWGGL